MVWGLLVAALTIGGSLITKGDENARAPSSLHVDSRDDRLFLSGVALGLGFSLLYSSLAKQFRISEHLWLFWLYWRNYDESKDLTPYRKPAAALDATEAIQQSEDGEVRLLLSPNTASTPSLHVSLVTLQPNCEVPPRKACGVEFYYVVSGTGSFSQQGVVETTKIRKGDCFVVNVGNLRWISSKDSKDELLLLRATDGGSQYSSPHMDRIRHDPFKKDTSIGRIANRLRQVQWQ